MGEGKVKMVTTRLPQELVEAMDKAVRLGLFPSRNQLIIEATKEYLKTLSFAIELRVEAKKKAANSPLNYYRFLAEGLSRALAEGIGDSYTSLSERVGVALTEYPTELVEKTGKEIRMLIDSIEEGAAERGDTPMGEGSPDEGDGGGDPHE